MYYIRRFFFFLTRILTVIISASRILTETGHSTIVVTPFHQPTAVGPTHYTQEALPRLIYHHDRFYRCYNSISLPATLQLNNKPCRRWQGNGVVASVKTIVVVYQPGECFLGVMCRTHGRWLVERGYNNCAVPSLRSVPCGGTELLKT